MLRICHILSGDLWAGAEASAYHLLLGLKTRHDIECSAILLNKGKLADSIRNLNVPLHVFEESNMTFLEIYRAIRNLLKRRFPHVLHSHGYKQNILACLAAGRKDGIKLISTQHGLPETDPGDRSLKEAIINKLNYRTLSTNFHVVVVSRELRKNLIMMHKIQASRVSVIHNGILIPQDMSKKNKENAFVIGSAGRFFPVKDYPFLLEVAKEVVRETRDVRFVLAGDGPELGKIRMIIRKYGLERFVFLQGFVSDVNSFYGGLDLYLNTSRHEGIPMSVLEAMARGIPVVAPKVGGFEEIMDDGVHGFLLDKRHPRDFAEKCLALYRDDLLRRKMGVAGRENIVNNFSAEHMAQQYHQAYIAL